MADPRAGLRLIAVHAHPDDESSKGAALMAYYRSVGVEVLVVSATGGERGDILNPALMGNDEVLANIHEVRRAEMARAASILDVQHRWLGFVDSGYPDGDPVPPLPADSYARVPVAESGARLAEVIREFRPHVMLTYDENGGYPHPDHIMTHFTSIEGVRQAADPSVDLPGEPWQVLKVYYLAVMNKDRAVNLHHALTERGMESHYGDWIAYLEEQPWRHRQVTTRVPAGDFFEVRDEALRAHATQIDPDGWWFATPLELQREIHPTEDCELARSWVSTDLPETDVFAGIPDLASADQLARAVGAEPVLDAVTRGVVTIPGLTDEEQP